MAGSRTNPHPANPEPDEEITPFFRGWLWIWHGLTYTALIICMVQSLILTPRPVNERVPIIALSLAFAAWYVVAASGRYGAFENRNWLLMGYFAVGWGIWFGLTAYDLMFNLLLIGLYPQVFGVPPLRWKIIGALILTALTTWRQVLAGGHISWVYAVVIGMSTIASIALAVFIHVIMDQSQDRKRLIEELEAAQEGLAAAERQAGVMEERQRLAREIHDTLAQGFTSIIMHLETLEAVLTSDPAAAQRHLDLARNTARESLTDARRMVWALQPESLERASLAQAIERLAARWSEESGIKVGVAVTGSPCPTLPEVEITLLRAAQEALANVRRHAQAHEVTLTLSYMDDLIALDVQDDGAGFDPRHTPLYSDGREGGFGLRSMRERVEALDGTLAIESAPGQGTTVAVALPVFVDEAALPAETDTLQENR